MFLENTQTPNTTSSQRDKTFPLTIVIYTDYGCVPTGHRSFLLIGLSRNILSLAGHCYATKHPILRQCF